MAESCVMTIEIDPEVKQQFEDFCDNVGLSVSAAVNLFVYRVIKDNKLPFEIEGDMPNDETLKTLEEAKLIEANPDSYKSYANFDEVLKDVFGDDYLTSKEC